MSKYEVISGPYLDIFHAVIKFQSSSNDNAFEMKENNCVAQLFGYSNDESENDNAENQEIRHA